jgi:hypothetical protein
LTSKIEGILQRFFDATPEPIGPNTARHWHAWREAGAFLRQRKAENLTKLLATYVSADDANLPRAEFLTMVADRIRDDLAYRKGKS